MDVANVYVDFKLAVEEGTSFFRVLAQCFIYEDSQDDPIQIGEVSLHLFYPVTSTYLDLFGEADCLSSNLSYSLISLDKFCKIDKIKGAVAIFHTFFLNEFHDERELRIAIYKKLEEQLSLLNVEWIVISNSQDQVRGNIINLLTDFSEVGYTSFHEENKPNIMLKKISRT